MQYYRIASGTEHRLVVRDGNGTHDLTSAKPRIRTFNDLLSAADVAGAAPDDIARSLVGEASSVAETDLNDRTAIPLDADEIWAAGVTYAISEEAREAESSTPDVYLDVYGNDRPELFFKATSSRSVGPREPVGIRSDSTWDVPEPELGVVLYDGSIVGYTVGNDVSSRSIEGSNPLYLPQAKVYDRCCAIGPCVASVESITDPHDLDISLVIERDGDVVFEDATSTAEMVRTCDELVSYFTRNNAVPEVAVLLTGTSLVPEEGFTLEADDRVRIEIEDIGVLENSVTVV